MTDGVLMRVEQIRFPRNTQLSFREFINGGSANRILEA